MSAIGGAVAGVMADRFGRSKTLVITVARVRVLHRAVRLRDQLRDAAGLPRPAGPRASAASGRRARSSWPSTASRSTAAARWRSSRARGRSAGGWRSSSTRWSRRWRTRPWSWRIMFWTGALPAILIFYVRRNVEDAPAAKAQLKETRHVPEDLPGPDSLKTTLFAALLATGVQGGYYTLATWLPGVPADRARPDGHRHRRVPRVPHRRRVDRVRRAAVTSRTTWGARRPSCSSRSPARC